MLSAFVVGLLVFGQAAGETRSRRVVRHSVGSPRDGELVRGVRLTSAPGYYVASGVTAWGTPTTIEHLRTVLARVHGERPDVELRVGDISRRAGGPLRLHQSHQSGRDVDLGLVPPEGTRRLRGRFERVPAERIGLMDEHVTLQLLRWLAETADQPGGVQWILMDYALQKRLHAVGVAEGIDKAELDALFQYPHGRWAKRGLVRHFPRHRNHMHVRFACAPADRACRARKAMPPRYGNDKAPSGGKRLRKAPRAAKDARLPAAPPSKGQ